MAIICSRKFNANRIDLYIFPGRKHWLIKLSFVECPDIHHHTVLIELDLVNFVRIWINRIYFAEKNSNKNQSER
jgi:hypothetical protein